MLYTAKPAWVHVVNMRHSGSNLVSKMRTGAVALIECRARFIQTVEGEDKQSRRRKPSSLHMARLDRVS